MASITITKGQSLASVIHGLPTDEASLQKIRDANQKHPISDFKKMLPGVYEVPDELIKVAERRIQAKEHNANAPAPQKPKSSGVAANAPPPQHGNAAAPQASTKATAPANPATTRDTKLALEDSIMAPGVAGLFPIDLRTDGDSESAIAVQLLVEAQRNGKFHNVVVTEKDHSKTPAEYDFGDRRLGRGGIDHDGAAVYSPEVDAFWHWAEQAIEKHFHMTAPALVDKQNDLYKKADGQPDPTLIKEAIDAYQAQKAPYLADLKEAALAELDKGPVILRLPPYPHVAD